MTRTNVSQLKQGDIVSYYGGLFKVTAAPYESQCHRPKTAHLTTGAGPANCAVAESVCISGEVEGYFRPGTPWNFQGTVGGVSAVSYSVQ